MSSQRLVTGQFADFGGDKERPGHADQVVGASEFSTEVPGCGGVGGGMDGCVEQFADASVQRFDGNGSRVVLKLRQDHGVEVWQQLSECSVDVLVA